MNRKHQGQSFRNQGAQPQHRGMNAGRFDQKANYSGYDSDESSYEASRPSFRDTDYDLDSSTYETNERNRTPSRFSSLDEDRFSGRNASSSERFGYPSNMNSWTEGRSSTTAERPRFQSWDAGPQSSQSYGSSYGEGSLDQQGSSQRGFFGKGPKGYKRSDDRIKEDVCETLSRHPRVDASDIEVNVEDACVTLSGTVDSKEAKRAAEMIIENLSGVDDVKNEIRVKRQSDLNSAEGYSSSSGSSAIGATAGTKSLNSKMK